MKLVLSVFLVMCNFKILSNTRINLESIHTKASNCFSKICFLPIDNIFCDRINDTDESPPPMHAGNGFGDDGAKYLASAIEGNTWLRSVHCGVDFAKKYNYPGDYYCFYFYSSSQVDSLKHQRIKGPKIKLYTQVLSHLSQLSHLMNTNVTNFGCL